MKQSKKWLSLLLSLVMCFSLLSPATLAYAGEETDGDEAQVTGEEVLDDPGEEPGDEESGEPEDGEAGNPAGDPDDVIADDLTSGDPGEEPASDAGGGGEDYPADGEAGGEDAGDPAGGEIDGGDAGDPAGEGTGGDEGVDPAGDAGDDPVGETGSGEASAEDEPQELTLDVPEQTVTDEAMNGQEEGDGPFDYEPEPITSFGSDFSEDNDARMQAYIEIELNKARGERLRAGNRARGELGESYPGQAAMYDLLLPGIADVAYGRRSSTVFTGTASDLTNAGIQTHWTAVELGYDSITAENINAAYAAAQQLAGVSTLSNMIDALLGDCAYELYWYDKTAGCSYQFDVSYRTGSSGYIDFTGYTVTMHVAAAYLGDAADTVSSANADTVSAAIANAQTIAENASLYGDYGKLDYFRQQICSLVSYNHDAADDDSTPYGNPWQLIWVFDNDPSTNVVCEGYSKAFQYLAELTWNPNAGMVNVSVISVSGLMDGGRHMWNIVSMNGVNYLADITNCDDGMCGEPDLLFMTGYDSGSFAEGYTFNCDSNSGSVTYTYNADTVTSYGEPALTIASKAQESPVPPAVDSVSATDAVVNGTSYSFDITLSVTEATAAAGYQYGINFYASEQDAWNLYSNGGFGQGGSEVRNQYVDSWNETAIPGMHFYYRAYLGGYGPDADYVYENAVHEVTIPDNPENYTVLELNQQASLAAGGSGLASFTSAEGGVFIVACGNVSSCQACDSMGRGIGYYYSTQEEPFYVACSPGQQIWFLVNPQDGSTACTLTVTSGLGVLPALTLDTPEEVPEDACVYYSFTADETASYIITPGGSNAGYDVLENWGWSGYGIAHSFELQSGQTLWLRNWWGQGIDTQTITVSKFVPADTFSVQTVPLTDGDYGATWANFSLTYGAPAPQSGDEYSFQVYVVSKSQVASGFAGGEAWNSNPYFSVYGGQHTESASEGTVFSWPLMTEELMPGTEYWYQAALNVWNNNSSSSVRYYGDLLSFTTPASGPELSDLALGQTVSAAPVNGRRVFRVSIAQNGLYGIHTSAYDHINVRSAGGYQGAWASCWDYSSSGAADAVYRMPFIGHAGDTLYISLGGPAGNAANSATITVDRAENIMPRLTMDASLTLDFSRQTAVFVAPADGYYNISTDNNRYGIEIYNSEQMYWNSQEDRAFLRYLAQGEAIFFHGYGSGSGAESCTWTAAVFTPAEADSISSAAAREITATSAMIDVTASITMDTADSGYRIGIQCSRDPNFTEPDREGKWFVWGQDPSYQPRSSWTYAQNLNSLLPGKDYYYRAILYTGGYESAPTILLAENTVHNFKTAGSVNDLPEASMSEMNVVPAGEYAAFRFSPTKAGLYVIHSYWLDYISVETPGGSSNDYPYAIATDYNLNGVMCFYAQANQDFCISTAHTTRWDAEAGFTLYAINDPGGAVPAKLGETRINGTGVELFSFTAPTAGWYQMEKNWEWGPGTGFLYYWEDGDWYSMDGNTRFCELEAGQQVYLLVGNRYNTSFVTMTVTSLGNDLQGVFDAMAEDDDDFWFNINEVTNVTGSMTIPANLTVALNAPLTVQNGGSLTVNGIIQINEGGSILVENEGSLSIRSVNGREAVIFAMNGPVTVNGAFSCIGRDAYVQTVASDGNLETALNRVQGVQTVSMRVVSEVSTTAQYDAAFEAGLAYQQMGIVLKNGCAVTLEEDLPRTYFLGVREGAALTVPSGATVEVYGQINMSGGTLTNNGLLNVNNLIQWRERSSTFTNTESGVINVYGTVAAAVGSGPDSLCTITNNGQIVLRGGRIYANIIGNSIAEGAIDRCGDAATWNVSNGVLTITGTGSMWDYDNESGRMSPWRMTDETILKVVVDEGITRIGNDAFADKTDVTAVQLPDTLRSIGARAFNNMISLPHIALPESLSVIEEQAFYGCSALRSIEIPGNIYDLSYSTFMGCEELQTVVLHRGLASIEYGCFAGCSSLSTVYYEGSEAERNSGLHITEDGNEALLNAGWVFGAQSDVRTPAQVYGQSLELTGYIVLNFYLTLPDAFVNDANASVRVGNYGYGISEPTENGRYLFQIPLTAKQMRDTVYVELFDGEGNPYPLSDMDGNDVTYGYGYSVQAYINSAAARYPDDAGLQDLLTHMSDYGQYAQRYFGYRLDSTWITEQMQNRVDAVSEQTLTAYAPNVQIAQGNSAVAYGGTTLTLNTATGITHYFRIKEGTVSDYVFKLNGTEVVPVQSGSYYVVRSALIPAQNLDDAYNVTVSTKNGTQLISIGNYSALSYPSRVLAGGGRYDTDLQNLVRSIYLYNQAANGYFDNRA